MKSVLDGRGNTFGSISNFAEFYKISYPFVTTKLRVGWTFNEIADYALVLSDEFLSDFAKMRVDSTKKTMKSIRNSFPKLVKNLKTNLT